MPPGILESFRQLQLHDLMVFELKCNDFEKNGKLLARGGLTDPLFARLPMQRLQYFCALGASQKFQGETLHPHHQNDYMQLFLFSGINFLMITITLTFPNP